MTARLTALTLCLSLAAGCAEAAAAPPAVGDAAADFELKALDGEAVKLSKLTAGGPVVLLVLRGYPGYQCPLCTAQVGDFLGSADAFEKAGATLVFVYPGAAKNLDNYARDFVLGKDLPKNAYLVTDPDFTLVNRYGLRWNAPRETAYPSTFVIDKAGKVAFAKVSRGHGGRSSAKEVLAALGGGK